jgi:hypothetical protein
MKHMRTKQGTRAQWWAERLATGMEIAGRHHTKATHSLQQQVAEEAVKILRDNTGKLRPLMLEDQLVSVGGADYYLFADGSELQVMDLDELDQTLVNAPEVAGTFWGRIPEKADGVVVIGA